MPPTATDFGHGLQAGNIRDEYSPQIRSQSEPVIGTHPTNVSFSLSKSFYVIIPGRTAFYEQMTSLFDVRCRLLDLGLIAALICASSAALLRIGLVPNNPTAGVAAVYAPWTAANETMVRAVEAGARFVRFGGFQFIAVVMPERTRLCGSK